MSQKKYQITLAEEDGSWSAAIVRKVSSRKSTITKSQDGFGNEAEASTWAEAELKALLKVLNERNQRRDK
ncbi:MAG: DUF3622 domain-containing protein [Cellvibrionaceae bacterium]